MTRSVLSDLRAIRNVTQAIEFLGMTSAEFASLIPSQRKNRDHVSPQTVSDWKSGHRTLGGIETNNKVDSQLNHVARLLAVKISARYGREVGIKIVVKSPWRVTAWVWCEKCKTRHEWKRYGQRCKR